MVHWNVGGSVKTALNIQTVSFLVFLVFSFGSKFFFRYKILFLDVLFPINVTKIIYVDADQVVRTDMRELRDMDLHVCTHNHLHLLVTSIAIGVLESTETVDFEQGIVH